MRFRLSKVTQGSQLGLTALQGGMYTSVYMYTNFVDRLSVKLSCFLTSTKYPARRMFYLFFK